MASSSTERQDFIPYPTNRVVGTVSDAETARAAIETLLRAGFHREDIDVLHGDDDLRRLDPAGAKHGFLAQFQRTLIRAAAPAEEFKHLTHHLDDVRAGRFVIMVLARKRHHRIVAADILNHYGAEFVGFYGRWAWEELPPAAPPPVDSGTRAKAGEAAVPLRPEDVPGVFVRAWNDRDPDALAALFDDDAEFVNVTGLWWHDRASIRKAHAYGLERIFSESTLSAAGVKVKALSDDIAVVHARMTLSGQSPVGDVGQPRSRTTIFSFVVHRTPAGWRCASAHNTDVVPRMETNIIDESGALRSANYRSGRVS